MQEGWFVGLAPYGYRDVCKDGRGVIEIDPEAAANVKRIFHLYAYENRECVVFSASLPCSRRSCLMQYWHNLGAETAARQFTALMWNTPPRLGLRILMPLAQVANFWPLPYLLE